METTSGLGLKLPGDSDYYDVEDMNYNSRKIDQEFQKSINSEQGMHGVRYYDGKLQVKVNEAWKETTASLPPRPTSNVTAKIIGYQDGTNELSVSWTKGAVYDVQVDKFNIYGYVGSASPTSFSQFTLITSVSNTSSSLETNASQTYDYILVAPVSTDGVIQEDLSQMCQVIVASNMPVKGTTLEEMSWGDIKAVADAGLAESYFNIGDKKTMTFGSTSYITVISDFNHDDKADDTGKAPISMLLKNCLSSNAAMNSSNTNSGGWGSCNRRGALQSTTFNTLPEELRNVICPVKKKTSAGNQSTTINTTTDTLFLLSEVEVFGSTTYSVAGEGSQYPIFTDNASRVKKLGDTGSATIWWLRSPYASSSTGFCYVSTDGSASLNGASSSFGLCFGFCI